MSRNGTPKSWGGIGSLLARNRKGVVAARESRSSRSPGLLQSRRSRLPPLLSSFAVFEAVGRTLWELGACPSPSPK